MRTTAVIAIGAMLCLPVPAVAELVVNISKADQQLSVVVDGRATYRWPVSTGAANYPTPAGTYRPIRLEKDWHSRKYNMTPMPSSVFFFKGYAVHGTLETNRLGHAVSHGCVRLLRANASILFGLVRAHGMNRTRIVVMNGPLPNAPVITPPTPRPPPTDAPVGVAQRAPVLLVAHRPEPPSSSSRATRHVAQRDEDERKAPQKVNARVGRVEDSSSFGSNEAQILRERAAWLRSIDREYGITH